jgi:hypothetical protein
MTIDMLPDVALLAVFDFYIDGASTEGWHTLVHVCQNWRSVVFRSPRRLNLRLYPTISTPVRETLDVWPPHLPIVIWTYDDAWSVDNIIAALEHNHRICTIELVDLSGSNFENILAAMQRPFPELTRLRLDPDDLTPPNVPASFLGGSAPRLQELYLCRISFTRLPKLLLSAPHLVRLDLRFIPDSGYISPGAMVTGLSALSRLEILRIDFDSPEYLPGRKSPPLPTRILLPVLTKFRFEGVSDYLEDLVAWIDAPLLSYLRVTFYHQVIFNTPQLTQFISRTPNFKAPNRAHLVFSSYENLVAFPQSLDGALKLRIYCGQSEHLSTLARVCNSSFFPQAFIPAVEHLYLDGDSKWQEDIENNQWLELFHPFASVKVLHISQRFAPHIVPTLQEFAGERLADVLPALQTIFLEEPLPSVLVLEDTGWLAGYPIVVSRWVSEEYEFSSSHESEDDVDRVAS